MIILIIATLILIGNWILEYRRHSRKVAAIPIRIHVNGTRGKSSVTRLIAAGLRAGNVKTVAKITGTQPRVVLSDGREAAIIRLQGANIIEQKYIFRYAATQNPDAIVIECMAVNPVFQWITERKFVKSTISVITNCRPDHLDQMGSTVQSVTMSLSNTIPKNGVCFTAENQQFGILKKIADQRNCKIHKILPTDVTDEEMSKFSHIEHKDNVQLALAVCAEAGVSREIALKGMQEATPDPGALKKYIIPDRDKDIHFYNVFAANDPESTVYIYNLITKNLVDAETFVILNSRADRLFRSQQLIDALEKVNYDYLLLTGEIVDKVEDYAHIKGISKDRVIAMGMPLPEDVYNKVWELAKTEAHVLGIGNIAGEINYGAQLVAHFKHKQEKLNKGAGRG